MILEVAALDATDGEENTFEAAFANLQAVLINCFIQHCLQNCLEKRIAIYRVDP